MPRSNGAFALCAIGETVLNFLAATFGTTIVEASFYATFHPHTLRSIFIKELVLSVVSAFALGIFAFNRFQHIAAKWL